MTTIRINHVALFALAFAACALPSAETAPLPEHTATAAQALTCVTIQRGTASPNGTVADAGTASGAPTTNNGSGTTMAAGAFAGATLKRDFLSFGLSGIPSGATITGATLALYVSSLVGSPVVNVHPITSTWAESTVTWATQPTYGVTLAAISSGTGAQTAAIPTATVAGWLAGPNYGVALESDAAGSETFATSEATTAAQRPALTVCYTLGSCSDGVKDGAETDVDCGGGCPACANGLGCALPADCASGACGAGVCVPYGGESTTVLSTCTYLHDATILPASYSYGSDPANLIDVYTPTGTPPGGGWPLVVLVHGGGFTTDGGGRASGALAYFCQMVAAGTNGIQAKACASIDYRLMSGHYPTTVNPYPAAVNDALSVQAWIAANASTLGVDVTRVAWAGFSAGAHLAAKVATSTVSPRIARWVTYYPNLYFDTPSWWSASYPALYDYAGCAAGDTSCLATKAPALNYTPAANDPPWFGSHDELDSVVLLGMSTRAQTAMRSVGVNGTLVTIPGVNAHGYGPSFGGPALPSTCTDFYNFLNAL